MCQHTMVLMRDEPLDGLPEAKGVIGYGETSDLGYPGSPLLLQTMALKVIEAQYSQRLQCHPGQIDQTDPDILDEVGGIKRKHI